MKGSREKSPQIVLEFRNSFKHRIAKYVHRRFIWFHHSEQNVLNLLDSTNLAKMKHECTEHQNTS